MGQGGLWGEVRQQGQEASADSRDPWGGRHRGKDSLLWHWKGPLPQPSSLEGQGTLRALRRPLPSLCWAEGKAYPCYL